jgi:predicted metal-dependent peptidase
MTDPTILHRASRRIAKARTQLLLNPKFVFWATCALHLKPVPYEGMMVCERGPIGTDGTRLYYDPDFIVGGLGPDYCAKFGVSIKQPIEPWTDDELLGVMAHEVSHATKGDCWRRGSRDPAKWNRAADRRINQELLKNGLSLPKDGELGTAADFGRSAEEIYKEIPDDPGGNGKGQGQGGPGEGGSMAGDVREPGDPQPGDDPSKGNSMSAAERQAAAQDLQRKWELVARQAAQIAKAQGHLPLGSEHLIEPIRPQLDPYAMLRHFVSMCRRDDYSWSRGSRRAAYRNLYLPSLYSEGIGELLIGMDTSGSCASVAPLFLGFLNSVLMEVKPERVWFVECDAAVHAVTEFGEGEALPEQVPVHGFGGTSMRPIWEWADEHAVTPVCAIVLTDLEMTDRDLGDGRPYPVLWVSSTDRIAPWGETVRMEA